MRIALIIFLLILVFFEILILFPKQTDQAQKQVQAEKSAPESQQSEVQQKIQGLHLVESRQGTRDWELFARHAQSYQERNEWDLEQVRILFYNNEVQDMVVRGDHGRIHAEKRDMRIEGNVEIETANGYIFQAPYVEYNSKLRLIQCAGLVQVKGPIEQRKRSLFMKATGMRIPVTERKMYLESQVSGYRVFPSEEKTLTFKSESAELSAITKTAVLRKNVIMNYNPMVMKSQVATFSYSEATKEFQYLELDGKVELKDQGRRAVSENLKVNFEKREFTFSGYPRLYQGDDELVGEQIIFMDNGKRVKVENVRARGSLKE